MTLALLLAAAVLPVAAQPKLLVNAKVDTRSAAAGLEREFKPLLSAQPQPAWIGYSVPVGEGRGLGCELVSPNGWWAPGTVHLEPPTRMLVMFRVEANAVERVRVLSPDCEIDARDLPVHWLDGVDPAQSDALLISFARGDRNTSVRSEAILALGRSPGPKALEAITEIISSDPDAQVRRRAVTALRDVPALIQVARTSRDGEIRKLAMNSLSRTHDPRATAFFEQLLK